MARILLIEDDLHIFDVVEFRMEEGHRMDWATDAGLGWDFYQKGWYARVILDLGPPGIHGLDVFAARLPFKSLT